jgi:DNA-directed RNA polymerase subunit RPC12/RpoP
MLIKYLIVVAMLLCSAVCWGEELTFVAGDEHIVKFQETTYICEQCGKETQYPFQFGTNEDYGRYCPYCLKKLADKYLPKVIVKDSNVSL